MDAKEAIRALEEMLDSLRASQSSEKPEKPVVSEGEQASFVRSTPLLQTRWSGSVLGKYVTPTTSVLTRWVYPWKGKYIDWRDMVNREVTIIDGLEETLALVLHVGVPDIWWWQNRFGDDAGVVFAMKGDEAPHQIRLSEFVKMVRTIVTPIS